MNGIVSIIIHCNVRFHFSSSHKIIQFFYTDNSKHYQASKRFDLPQIVVCSDSLIPQRNLPTRTHHNAYGIEYIKFPKARITIFNRNTCRIFLVLSTYLPNKIPLSALLTANIASEIIK